jgi:hypothetical protein
MVFGACLVTGAARGPAMANRVRPGEEESLLSVYTAILQV